MSLKTLLPLPSSTSPCYKWLQLWLLQVMGKNRKKKKQNKQNARLALRTGFNTVYIAPVMVWKCSQP